VPLYMAGARLVNYAPISIAIDGMGLNVTGFSYAGTMWICAVSCRDMLPDPAFFADCLRGSFAELKAAAERELARVVPEAGEAARPALPAPARKARRPAKKAVPASGSKSRRSRKAAAPAARTGRRKRKAVAKTTPAQE
jgi:diacylglycerol O-acyltransferase / wax synthase